MRTHIFAIECGHTACCAVVHVPLYLPACRRNIAHLGQHLRAEVGGDFAAAAKWCFDYLVKEVACMVKAYFHLSEEQESDGQQCATAAPLRCRALQKPERATKVRHVAM